LIDTCDRRSIGCVYYKWQLVFIDIINNNKLSILYCNWRVILIVKWYYRHLILVLTAFIIVHLYFACYFSLISVYIFIVCLHVICTALSSYTHWEFLALWICTFRFMYVILLTRCFEEVHTHEEVPGVFLLDHPFLVYYWFSLFLLFSWFFVLDSIFFLFFYSSVIMNDHLYVLLQWYWSS